MNKKLFALHSFCATALLGLALIQSATAQTVTLAINNLSSKPVTIWPQLTVTSASGTATLNSGTAPIIIAANSTNSAVTVSLSPVATGVSATVQVNGTYDNSPFVFIQPFYMESGTGQILTAGLNTVRPFTSPSVLANTGSGATITATIPANPVSFPETKWKINELILQKNGVNFFAKGLCYSPTPIGGATDTPAIGDWFGFPWWTYNGANDVNDIGMRDIRNLKAMKVTAIRTYFTWFWWKNPDLNYLKGITQDTPATTFTQTQYPYTVFFDHTNFLDACYSAGIYVVLGIPLEGGNCFAFSQTDVSAAYQNFYLQTATKLATLYGKHPAVLGFCMSNEQNQGGWNYDSRTWLYYMAMYQAIKTAAPDKLVTIAFQDDTHLYDGTKTVTDQASQSPPTIFNGVPIEQAISMVVDIWGINNYGNMANHLGKFQKNVVKAQNGAYARPVWFTEWGVASGRNSPRNAEGPPNGTAGTTDLGSAGTVQALATMSTYTSAMQNNLNFVAGGFFFEYCDEWWKNSSGLPYVHDGGSSVAWPEEHWGLFGLAVNGRDPESPNSSKPDILNGRKSFINALEGKYKNLENAYSKKKP